MIKTVSSSAIKTKNLYEKACIICEIASFQQTTQHNSPPYVHYSILFKRQTKWLAVAANASVDIAGTIDFMLTFAVH